MKKKKIYAVILLILTMTATILLPSCKKLLDMAPEDAPYEGSFWKTQDDALSALAGVYSLSRKSMFRGDYSHHMSHFTYGDLSTNEFIRVNNDFAPSALIEGGSGMPIGNFIGPYLEDLGQWDSYYKTINMANTVLDNVGKMPGNVFTADRKNRILGESYFLRAFNYFYMVRLWGDVPLVMKNNPDPVASANLPRTSEIVVLDSAMADLARAQRLLKFSTGTGRSVSADKAAVFALKAHILRWQYFLGKNTDRNLLTQAVAAVDSITNTGSYSLVPAANFDRLFKGRSPEAIFEIPMSLSDNEFQLGDGFYDYSSMQPYIKDKGDMRTILNNNFLSQMYYYDNDARYAYYFDKTKVDNWILTKYTGRNGENVKFRNPENSTNALVDCDIPVFRLGEQLLLRAECNDLLGNPDAALTDLNSVKKRSNLDDYDFSNTDLKTEIFEETYREIAFEGHLWYVMVRNNQLPAYTEGRFPQSRFDQEGWRWPIARSILQKNQLLVQNKYWNGKL